MAEVAFTRSVGSITRPSGSITQASPALVVWLGFCGMKLLQILRVKVLTDI